MAYATLPAPILRGIERTYSIEMLWEGTSADRTVEAERQLLNLVLPPWQRPAVWSERQQVAFIEGIFLGLGTGHYVVNGRNYNDEGDMPMSGWLIDGQQRITAIARFKNDDLQVFGGIRYSDLSIGDRRRRFNNVVFPCFELEYQPNENLLKELYKRLNFSGTAHTHSDLALLDSTAPLSDLQASTEVTSAAVRQ